MTKRPHSCQNKTHGRDLRERRHRPTVAAALWAKCWRACRIKSLRAAISPPSRAITDEPARAPLTLGEQIGFAWIGLSESEWAARIESDLESSAWHAGALQAAIEVLSNPFNPLTAAHLPTSESGLVERWQSANAPELRRLALAALVGQATENRGEGWTNARLSRLEKLRADAAPLVAAAAQWTFPGDETA